MKVRLVRAMSLLPNCPLVSIIIPCWNGANYVSDAIESALAQTYPKVEVIVIDDGSTDDTPAILQSFYGRIRWESTLNRGACAARNRGLELAKGEFIQFLDVDDLLHADKIAKQLEVATSHETDIVYCARETYGIDHPKQTWVDSPTNGDDDLAFALTKIITVACPLYRKKQLASITGFRTDLPCAQDYDLNLRLALQGFRFKKLDQTLVTVRRRTTSVSSDSIKVLRQMRLLWRELLLQLAEKGELNAARRKAIAMCFASAGRVLVRNDLHSEAEELFQEAHRTDAEGVRAAYSAATWFLRELVGSDTTETLVRLKRRLTNINGRPI